ncbi:MAG: aspartate kinase [Chloroflexi bacterium]|jgi:aspartate kinase|nr:aspartate kinase [Chloroflexota bacterium]|tara:strand:+ start:7934 stop:9190 length:1257 start_codon:yes stop_codon:yes gene_type:complete
MELIVRKYGGTSLDSISKIKNIAKTTKKSINEGKKIVLVVSAMGKSTDELLNKAKMLSNHPNIRELDLLMSSGEIVSSALMSIALQELGLKAISLTGFQAGIDTNSTFGEAQIVSIDNKRINNEINNGQVVVIAGFQGYNENFEITTLGRGGSDTTAVALAASLKADICEVYTDVEGIFTADPKIVKSAKKIDYLSYEDMLELANYGAKMHPRSIELGLHYNMPIIIKSAFENGTGTIISNIEKLNDLQKRGIILNKITENRNKVTGVTSEGNISKITIHNVPDKPGIAAKVFKPLSEAGINVDVIVQNVSRNNKTDLTFTVKNEDLTHALNIVQNKSIKNINYENITSGSNYAKISIIGTGIQNSPGYAAKFFEALFKSKVNIEMITTSDIRITCLINEKDINKAINKIHDVFKLFQ